MSALDAARAADELTAALRESADPERAEHERRYLRSDLTHLGVPVPAIRRATTRFARARADLRRPDVLALATALWAEPVHERRVATVELLGLHGALLEAGDIALVERLLRESGTWALADHLAEKVAGGLVERFPELGDAVLDGWARDEDLWLRRSALLTLLGPLRRGEGDFERFGRYADAMLEEREFFVRKAIGWVLRDTGKRRPELVHAWLAPRATRAAGLTVREAVRHLPHAAREDILGRRAG